MVKGFCSIKLVKGLHYKKVMYHNFLVIVTPSTLQLKKETNVCECKKGTYFSKGSSSKEFSVGKLCDG